MKTGNNNPSTPLSIPGRAPNGKQPAGRSSGNGHQPALAEVKSPQVGSPLQSFAGLAEENLSPDELAGIWARRAYVLAEEPPVEATGQTIDLLVFRLGSERYGLEVSSVREIYPLQQLTRVPRAPGFVAGVFSARGRILSIVDLRVFLDLPTLDLSDQTKIIVVANTNPNSDVGQMELGLLADDVTDVLTIFKADIQPPLTTHTGARADYIQGVTADMLVVLNLNALLSDKHLIVHQEIL